MKLNEIEHIDLFTAAHLLLSEKNTIIISDFRNVIFLTLTDTKKKSATKKRLNKSKIDS